MPMYTAGRMHRWRTRKEWVVESLVIPFAMIVLDELFDRTPEMPSRRHIVTL